MNIAQRLSAWARSWHAPCSDDDYSELDAIANRMIDDYRCQLSLNTSLPVLATAVTGFAGCLLCQRIWELHSAVTEVHGDYVADLALNPLMGAHAAHDDEVDIG